MTPIVWVSSDADVAARTAVRAAADDLGIDAPRIQWVDDPRNSAWTECPDHDVVYLRHDLRDNTSRLTWIVFHEMRHVYLHAINPRRCREAKSYASEEAVCDLYANRMCRAWEEHRNL